MFVSVSIGIYEDVYVQGILHVDEGYRNGRVEPGFDVMYEWWFGENKITFIRHSWSNFKNQVILPYLRFTLNKEKQYIKAINFSEKSFGEVPLPMNLLSHVDQSLTGVLNAIQINGTIKKTNKKTIINKKNCDVYEVTEKIDFQKNHYYDKDRIVMLTCDVPFDWQMVNELCHWIRSFFNPQTLYLSELEGMKGFVWATKEILFLLGYQLKMSFKVLKIVQKKAPENIYDIPRGFKKKEKFTMSDLGNILGAIYVIVP